MRALGFPLALWAGALGLALGSVVASQPAAQTDDPTEVPIIREFIGAGFGALHPQAPPETVAFGRFVGVWRADQQLRRRDGSWVDGGSAYWVWKYAPGGFAVQDLWYQAEDELPEYLQHLERAYLVTSLRIFDPAAGVWRVSWAANTAGTGQGDDFGTFAAEARDDRIAMSQEIADPDSPPQRIYFHSLQDDSFEWTSEYSMDGGETFEPVARISVRRVQ